MRNRSKAIIGGGVGVVPKVIGGEIRVYGGRFSSAKGRAYSLNRQGFFGVGIGHSRQGNKGYGGGRGGKGLKFQSVFLWERALSLCDLRVPAKRKAFKVACYHTGGFG
jgi:hypothetical protein